MRYIFIVLGVSVLFSFCHIEKNVLKIEPVYRDLCGAESFVSLQRDTVIIIENSNPNVDTAAAFFYKEAFKSGDTLLAKRLRVKYQASVEVLKRELRTRSFVIEEISQYTFRYDKIPDTLNHLFNKNEEVLYFIDHNEYWVYLTRNNSNGVYRIYVSEKVSQNTTFIELSRSPERSDFLLFDIVGNNVPELMVVRKTHLMNRDLRDIDIYRINNITKKAF